MASFPFIQVLIQIRASDEDVKATSCWMQQINKLLLSIKDNFTRGNHMNTDVMHLPHCSTTKA